MSVRKNVSLSDAEWGVSATPEWVQPHEPKWDFQTKEEVPFSYLLVDEQRRVDTRSDYARTVRLLHDIAAVQRLSQVELDFDPAGESLQIHAVLVWRRQADGAWASCSSPLPREAFMLRQREQQLEQQILNGRLSVVALLEDVRVGDAIELAWTIQPREPWPGFRFAGYCFLGWRLPVARFSYTIYEDPSQPLQVRIHTFPGTPPPIEVPLPGARHWQMENLPPLEVEPNTPGSFWPCTVMDFSCWPSWQAVAAFVAETWKEALAEAQQNVHDEVARLREGAPDLATAILRAIHFVQEEVRYLAVDFGHGGGILPNAAATVLRRRFGDCKDKSVLLTAMLRVLGVEAWPMLVAPNWREQVAPVQPSVGAFSHAITAFIQDGKWYFIDPTFQYQGGDLERIVQPGYGSGLIVSPETVGLRSMPAYLLSTVDMVETFTFDKKKKMGTLTQVITLDGWRADGVRSMLAQSKTPFAENELNELKQHFEGVEPQGEPIVRDEKQQNIIRWERTYSLPKWGPRENPKPANFQYAARGLHWGLDHIEGPEKRQTPWAMRHPVRVHHQVTIKAKKVGKESKDRGQYIGPAFKYVWELNSKKGTTTFDFIWESTAESVPAKDFEEYLETRRLALNFTSVRTPLWKASTKTPLSAWLVLFFVVSIVGKGIVAGIRNEEQRPAAGSKLTFTPKPVVRDRLSPQDRALIVEAKQHLAAKEPAFALAKLEAVPLTSRDDSAYLATKFEALLARDRVMEAQVILNQWRQLGRRDPELAEAERMLKRRFATPTPAPR